MSDAKPRRRPETFVDSVYRTRTIRVGDARLRVRDGRITVTDPVHIEALEREPSLRREPPRC